MIAGVALSFSGSLTYYSSHFQYRVQELQSDVLSCRSMIKLYRDEKFGNLSMKKWFVVLILCLAQFVMVLDSTVMNVSISTVVGDLNTSVNALQTAITFYTLTMAALMLIGAKLSARIGLLRGFIIGSIIYGLGSLITGLSQNIQSLMIGWSFIEGIGAVLVIPSIAALIAVNYAGKDRIVAFAAIGGISGAAAAAGPLIGGYMTTYLSWRYVFFIETAIMGIVLVLARKFKSSPADKTQKIDFASALLSSAGMILLVYGMLQSKVWGWVTPLGAPEIGGEPFTPLGISLVAYMIVAGLILLKVFYDRQLRLEQSGGSPLVNVSMFRIARLRSGLGVLLSQYVITAAVFFVVPVYLQMALGFNALQTGLKILPLSVSLIVFSLLGTKMVQKYSPKKIVKIGQSLLLLGAIFLLAAIKPDLASFAFGLAMFAVGAGLGLLASQLGNINMSAVDDSKSSEIGGLQGSFQNLGSSLGVAVIGSIMIISLTTGFISRINSSDIPNDVKGYIATNSQKGVQIVPSESVEAYARSEGLSALDAESIASDYRDAQVEGLRESVFIIVAIAALSLLLSQNLPDKTTIPKKG